MRDWNKGIIEEFRSNNGEVGGYFAGRPILLISHTGARTGNPRTDPVTYLKDGNRYLVFASKGGADTNPDWYYNLKAHPDVKIEVGTISSKFIQRRLPGSNVTRYTRDSLVSCPSSPSTHRRQSGSSLS